MGKKSFSATKLRDFLILRLQHIWITIELYQKNRLANHAAAGAYAFLLSAAPVLLIISYFISRFLVNSPELVADMLQGIGFLSGVINANEFINNFLGSTNPGFAGILTVIPLLWTARLCALSMQRGLGVIFPSSRFNPIKAAAIPLGLGFLVILYIFTMLMESSLAQYFYKSLNFFLQGSVSSVFSIFPSYLLSLIILAVLVMVSYRIIPENPPKWKYIITGALICIVLKEIFTFIFSIFINPDRYNLLYGALGRLFLLLANVYFFFIFFLLCAQFIMVQNYSEPLLFIRFRKQRLKSAKSLIPFDRLFTSLPSSLSRYSGFFRGGEVIFIRGSVGTEVYYVLSGKAGVYLDEKCLNRIDIIEENHFFGEMEFVVSDGRSASIKAETDLSVLILPRDLFRSIMQNDPDTDQNLILDLSERLRSRNR